MWSYLPNCTPSIRTKLRTEALLQAIFISKHCIQKIAFVFSLFLGKQAKNEGDFKVAGTLSEVECRFLCLPF